MGCFLNDAHLPCLLPRSSFIQPLQQRSGGSGEQGSCASRAAITCLREPNSNIDVLLWRKPGEGAINYGRKKEK